MLDTIVIKTTNFKVTDFEYFTRTKKEIRFKNNKPYMPIGKKPCLLHNIKKRKNIYYPVIEIQRRLNQLDEIIIQVSIPKLLYDINAYDIDENCLNPFAERLKSALSEAKVIVTNDAIIDSVAKAFHPSKVMNFTGICSAYKILEVLLNFNYKTNYDFTEIKYNFGKSGESVKLYGSPLSIIFYDKIAEIENKGYTIREREAAKTFRKSNIEIIKVEIQIQQKQKISRLAHKFFGIKKNDWTLREIFNKEFCRFIINGQVKSIIDSKLAKAVKISLLDEKMLDLLIKKYFPRHPNQLEAYGIIYRIQNNGLAKTMKDLKQGSSPATYKRKKKRLNSIFSLVDVTSNKKIAIIDEILRQLDEFKLITPSITQTKVSEPFQTESYPINKGITTDTSKYYKND